MTVVTMVRTMVTVVVTDCGDYVDCGDCGDYGDCGDCCDKDGGEPWGTLPVSEDLVIWAI